MFIWKKKLNKYLFFKNKNIKIVAVIRQIKKVYFIPWKAIVLILTGKLFMLITIDLPIPKFKIVEIVKRKWKIMASNHDYTLDIISVI